MNSVKNQCAVENNRTGYSEPSFFLNSHKLCFRFKSPDVYVPPPSLSSADSFPHTLKTHPPFSTGKLLYRVLCHLNTVLEAQSPIWTDYFYSKLRNVLILPEHLNI